MDVKFIQPNYTLKKDFIKKSKLTLNEDFRSVVGFKGVEVGYKKDFNVKYQETNYACTLTNRFRTNSQYLEFVCYGLNENFSLNDTVNIYFKEDEATPFFEFELDNMEKTVKIYNINSAEASRNMNELLKAPYFYWDIKSFVNDEPESEVFFICERLKKAFYAILENGKLPSTFDSARNSTSFSDNNFSYTAAGKWGDFVKFKIIDEAVIPDGWEFQDRLGNQNPVNYLYKYQSRLNEIPKRIQKLEDLKKIFSTESTQNRINEVIGLLGGPGLPTTPTKKKEKSTSDPKEIIKKFTAILSEKGLFFSDDIIARYIASLLSKPFVILTGLSGSGKTKIAQAFAMWICENKNQYCIVPVGADWTNREPLLGFPNALQSGKYVKPDNKVLDLIIESAKPGNETKPYFLILDEMNLSHVERYFADFLSVMESKEKVSLHTGPGNWGDVPHEIGFPKNLFIIGTVNIDETTYMFSPKVLDRANVIEFRVTHDEMKKYLGKSNNHDLESLKSVGANLSQSFVDVAIDKSLQTKDVAELQTALLIFFSELKKTGAEFGYRSASEINRFAAVVNKIKPEWEITEIIDAAIMQKLLPKVHGSRKKLEPVLKKLAELCLNNPKDFDDIIKSEDETVYSQKGKYPLSLEKISRMYKSLMYNGFTSYAEA